jgi:hypothetical protein
MLYAEGLEGERGGLNLSGWEYGLLWMSRFVCVVCGTRVRLMGYV